MTQEEERNAVEEEADVRRKVGADNWNGEDAVPEGETERGLKFRLVAINARSLKGSRRMWEVIVEAGERGWGAILVQEKWQMEEEEDFIVLEGHHWLASGGPGNKHGAVILVHKRWSTAVEKSKVLARQRAVAVDVNVGGGLPRLVSAYLPHAVHKDEEVEAISTALPEELTQAAASGATVVVGGDFQRRARRKATRRA